MMKKYCHLCGALNIAGKTQPWECSGCGNKSYYSPAPTVDMALFNEQGQILVTKRGHEPAKGKMDLPGGFIDPGEKVAQALDRELQEELGLSSADYTEPQYIDDLVGNYAFSKEKFHTTGLIFAAKLNSSVELKANDDVASFAFVAIEDLENIDFSLDIYREIIKKAHKILFG